MTDLIAKTIAQLNGEIKSYQEAIFTREAAIQRLRHINSTGHVIGVKSVVPAKKKRRLSKDARRRIAEAQRKRWAAQKAKAKK